MTILVAASELVGFLGVAEAWEGVGGAFAVNFDFHRAFGFGAGFAEDGEGGQGFVVNLSNQVGFAGVVLLPDLADLEFAGGHITNVVRIGRPVNISARSDSGATAGRIALAGASERRRHPSCVTGESLLHRFSGYPVNAHITFESKRNAFFGASPAG